MAPATAAAKALQSNRPRPTVARPIIPAIPLPYMTKRKQHVVPVAKVKQEVPVSAVTPPVTESASTIVQVADDVEESTKSPEVAEIETPKVGGEVGDKKNNPETDRQAQVAQRMFTSPRWINQLYIDTLLKQKRLNLHRHLL